MSTPRSETVAVQLRVPASLRHLVGGVGILAVPVLSATPTGTGTTVGSMLDALAGLHPALERRIRDEQGCIRAHVNLFVGSDNVRDRSGPDTPITAGDVVSLIPAVSGG